jgi:hypothetical protein
MPAAARLVAAAVAVVLALAGVATLSPEPDRVTDRSAYEATAAMGIVPDCEDLHCFRVLVPWMLGPLPVDSTAKWKGYAVAANAAAAAGVVTLVVAWGLSWRAAVMAGALTAFGFGSLYTLHDPFTADPLMYALAPWVLWLMLKERVAIGTAVGVMGVLAKEFVAAAMFISAAAAALAGRRDLAWRILAGANLAVIAWLALQLTLILRFNYGYGDNPSTHLLAGGFLAKWLSDLSPRAAAIALLGEFGALWILAPAGIWLAPAALRRVLIVSLPVAAIFVYVQQPDRALWNFHFVVTPLAALVLAQAPAAIAWLAIGTFAFANLRLGAQLPFVPPAGLPLAVSFIAALAAIVAVWMRVKDGGPIYAAENRA